MPPSFYKWSINTNHPMDSNLLHRPQEQEHLSKPRYEWDFALSTVVSPSVPGDASDILGAIEFDPTDRFLATGGIARKIRIYDTSTLLSDANSNPNFTTHAGACSFYMCTPAKLSSLRWRPDFGGNIICSGDYDGVVTEYDVERQVPVFERDEHGGRRIWTVDYSNFSPHLGASGSDDGSIHLWDPRCVSKTAGEIFPGGTRSPVCSVEFDPTGGPLISTGSADKNGYVYDLRVLSSPVTIFRGHNRTVTYVRFIEKGRIATASTDGSIRMWEILDGKEVRRYEGHVNRKSFVGLSVWRNGGLLGCGSESDEVFVYDVRWGEPIWVGDGFGEEKGFVSGVCWRPRGEEECLLVAGGSNGVLKLFGGRKKPITNPIVR